MIASPPKKNHGSLGAGDWRPADRSCSAAAFSCRSSAALRVCVCTRHYHCVLPESERDCDERDELIVKWSQVFVPA